MAGFCRTAFPSVQPTLDLAITSWVPLITTLWTHDQPPLNLAKDPTTAGRRSSHRKSASPSTSLTSSPSLTLRAHALPSPIQPSAHLIHASVPGGSGGPRAPCARVRRPSVLHRKPRRCARYIWHRARCAVGRRSLLPPLTSPTIMKAVSLFQNSRAYCEWRGEGRGGGNGRLTNFRAGVCGVLGDRAVRL